MIFKLTKDEATVAIQDYYSQDWCMVKPDIIEIID